MNAYSGLIRLPQVIELTGLSERTIYRYEGKGNFPKKNQTQPKRQKWCCCLAQNGYFELGEGQSGTELTAINTFNNEKQETCSYFTKAS